MNSLRVSELAKELNITSKELIEKFAEALNVDYTKLFRTEHLQSRKILIAKINELLKASTDEELKTIYKIVFGCID